MVPSEFFRGSLYQLGKLYPNSLLQNFTWKGKESVTATREPGAFKFSSIEGYSTPICFIYHKKDTVEFYAYAMMPYITVTSKDKWHIAVFNEIGWLWIFISFTLSMRLIHLILGRVFRSLLFTHSLSFLLFFLLLVMTYTRLTDVFGIFFLKHTRCVEEFAMAGSFLSLGLFT